MFGSERYPHTLGFFFFHFSWSILTAYNLPVISIHCIFIYVSSTQDILVWLQDMKTSEIVFGLGINSR